MSNRGRLLGLRSVLTLVLATSLLAGCASSPETTRVIPEGDYRDRISTQERDSIVVRAAVPSARETEKFFGIDLYQRGVQPVWLEIQNHSTEPRSFLPVGLDPTYYTPIEASKMSGRADSETEGRLFEAGLDLIIPAGESRSGFIFSTLDEGTKSFNVDIAGPGYFESFTFFIPVPGLRVDHYDIDFNSIYPQQEIRDLDKDQLIAWLEEQVCCTTDVDAEGSGDPVNLVVIGDLRDMYVAFIRAGWDETETITSGTTLKTVRSFFTGGEYRYSPVSGLYVFGRPQDVAFQKARENIHERNHLRLWVAPVTYQGKRVALGQISRDIGVRFTKKTITTHKIDPNVDETREGLLENLAYSGSIDSFAYVGGVGEVSINEPAGNLTGDPWFSDGYRMVLFVTSKPTDLYELDYLHWRRPYLESLQSSEP